MLYLLKSGSPVAFNQFHNIQQGGILQVLHVNCQQVVTGTDVSSGSLATWGDAAKKSLFLFSVLIWKRLPDTDALFAGSTTGETESPWCTTWDRDFVWHTFCLELFFQVFSITHKTHNERDKGWLCERHEMDKIVTIAQTGPKGDLWTKWVSVID